MNATASITAADLPFALHNPRALGAPLGAYAQVLEIPAGAALVFLSGQTPILEDGSVPEDFEAQAERVWQRIAMALAAVGLDCRHICRVVTYLVDPADAPAHARVRARYLGAARPASTGLVVSALFQPAYRLEVEVTAARAPAG
jgi:enamine deaminase RidA (YjgF/YER057c/UK114 family)